MPVGPQRVPTVFVADTPSGSRELKKLLGDPIRFVEANFFDDAVEMLRAGQPDLVILGYHFDGLRPFRLLQHIREQPALARVPVVVIRLFPAKVGRSKESEVDAAYRQLGAQRFFSMPDEADGEAYRAALRHLRHYVLDLLGIQAPAR